jgi:hypothetical protein
MPDGAALLESGGALAPIVVELDRGTESHHVLVEKLARYARVGGFSVVVCFTDPARARWAPPEVGARVLVGHRASHLSDPWGAVWADREGQRLALGDVVAAEVAP